MKWIKKFIKRLYSTLNMKVNDLENKLPDVSTLIQTNQYNTDNKI